MTYLHSYRSMVGLVPRPRLAEKLAFKPALTSVPPEFSTSGSVSWPEAEQGAKKLGKAADELGKTVKQRGRLAQLKDALRVLIGGTAETASAIGSQDAAVTLWKAGSDLGY